MGTEHYSCQAPAAINNVSLERTEDYTTAMHSCLHWQQDMLNKTAACHELHAL